MKIIKLISLSVILSLPTAALAVMPTEDGNITFLQVHQDPGNSNRESQRFIVRLNSTIAGGNNCGNNQWSGYLDTDAGRAQYSTLLALYLSGKPVQLQGTSPDYCIKNSVRIRNVYPKW